MARISKDPAKRREEIIETAERLFFAKGPDQTAISDIVRSIGVAQGTFYYHFESKEKVLEAVIDKNIAHVEQAMNRILQNSKHSAIERICLFIESLFQMEEKQKTVMCYLNEEQNRGLHEKVLMGFLERMTEPLTKVFKEGIETGDIDVINPRETVEFLLGAVGYLSHRAEIEPESDRVGRLKTTCLEMLKKMIVKSC